MRLLALTDLHGNEATLDLILDQAGPRDAILLGGDLTNFGSPDAAERIVRRVLATGANVWAVAGNCDSAAIDTRLEDLEVSLHGRGVLHEGIGLHGLSAMPPWRAGMYQFSEPELAGLLAVGYGQIAGAKRHVVLSHAPPHGTKLDRTRFFQHVGSTALREFIERTQPDLVLCGHIHESRGIEAIGRTVVVNCGAAKAGYYAVANLGPDAEIRAELQRA